ncbi:dTDP-D-glucose 4,6-dehydratase-like [Micropterus dolomieu]|uniref:dTDP-D-glucose 4,6-dehydratase-like n=1 Tax=Micropterus dolomieu TaxID=147949 RepID=UPI001E8D2847|nr:dTDP-D-glucose 4,6-dehydratase-like [Micropterus dolomieu]XP_045913656.1 dTDP-D-glucose 4,6-dehydratase-like [Micropterus dolomieu]
MTRMDFSRSVLVTGGSGFIGSHLVCSLVYRHPDWRIINLDNLDYCCSPRSLESVEDRANYSFIRGDVCNSRLVNHIFNTENIDVIFHLAAKTHVESSFETPSSFQHVNIEGTRVLLGAAHQARHPPQRFIYVSTDEVYGASLNEVFDESSPVRPSNPYSATKAAAEYLVRSYWDKYKFPIIITRSNNIYGPRQYTEKVIPRFLTLLQMNKKCTVQGTLPISRHFLFVDDAVNAFLLVLEKGTVGEIYNVGTSCEIPIVQLARELVKMVKNVPDSEVKDWLEFVPDRPCVDLRYPITCEKLQQLGWRAAVSWAEGIRQTVKWYKDNPDFWSGASEDQGQIRGQLEKATNK